MLFQACNIEPVDNLPDQKVETDNTFVKKIVYDEGTPDEHTEVYSYTDGNKLSRIDASGGYKSKYTYENNNLVREDIYFEGKLAAYNTLEYDDKGKLFKLVEYWLEETGFSERTFIHNLTHNNDKTIKDETFRSDMGSTPEFSSTSIISTDGSNISSIKDQDDTTSTEYIYSYDNKNGMFKNVYAIDVFNILSRTQFGPYMMGNTNNITSDKEVYNNEYTGDTIEYTYNKNDYPITGIGKRLRNGVEEDTSYTINIYYN